MKNKKKVTLLGVAFIAAVITLAGVGYALSNNSYTAQTTSASGDFDIDWVVLKLNEEAYAGPGHIEVVWNSETTGYANGHYTIAYDFIESDILTQTLTKDASASEATTFKLVADGAAFDGSGIYTLKYSVDNGENWLTYKEGDLFGDGISFTESTQVIKWKVDADDFTSPVNSQDKNPGSAVTMPAIIYLLTAESDP